MFAKMPRLLLMACVICPSMARALGLGEIHLNSALNEPLRAEIDLVAAAPEELTALHVSLASREAFARYGIDRPAFVTSFTFKVAKSADGRDVLLVRSADSIPEPFVTFLVEVNWARGRLMREYTVLLDPPTYTPGETAGSAAPVAAPGVPGTPPAPRSPAAPAPAMPAAPANTASAPRRGSMNPPRSASEATQPLAAGTYRTVSGDTLTRIAQRLRGGSTGQLDQTMLAIYRDNPNAFDGNINLLRRGAILRIPGADGIAALNQKAAIDEITRQMNAWRSGAGEGGGRLRLVTPKSTGEGAGGGTGGASAAGGSDVASLRNHVKDLEAQLAESKRLIDVSNSQLAELQRKLAAGSTAGAAKQPAPPAAAPAPTSPAAAAPAAAPAAAGTPVAASAPASAAQPATPAPAKPAKPASPAPSAQGGSWLDTVLDYWQIPAALFALLVGALGFTAYRRRTQRADADQLSALAGAPARTEAVSAHLADSYNVTESFGPADHAETLPPSVPLAAAPAAAAPIAPAKPASPGRTGDETMSAESPVSIDQGDPMAEADFHMAYGLYDQAADLVRMAIEREPDRRDLRMKLLEIYFVWGNAEHFLGAAKDLSATRDQAPAGEWEKVMIMGRQICPDEEMFRQQGGAGHGADASVDLNLDGGENHVDIDLFGASSIERAATGEPAAHEASARDSDSTAETGESPHLSGNSLDFMLDAPERGAEAAHQDEPTVESEQMLFSGDVLASGNRDDHTAEVEIQDLGFDLDHLEATDTPAGVAALEKTDQSPEDAPTVISGLDTSMRSRLASTAQPAAKDTDLTQLEKELEASFIAELAASSDEIKPDLSQETSPTINIAHQVEAPADTGTAAHAAAEAAPAPPSSTDSTARMEALSAESIDRTSA